MVTVPSLPSPTEPLIVRSMHGHNASPNVSSIESIMVTVPFPPSTTEPAVIIKRFQWHNASPDVLERLCHQYDQ